MLIMSHDESFYGFVDQNIWQRVTNESIKMLIQIKSRNLRWDDRELIFESV